MEIRLGVGFTVFIITFHAGLNGLLFVFDCIDCCRGT